MASDGVSRLAMENLLASRSSRWASLLFLAQRPAADSPVLAQLMSMGSPSWNSGFAESRKISGSQSGRARIRRKKTVAPSMTRLMPMLDPKKRNRWFVWKSLKSLASFRAMASRSFLSSFSVFSEEASVME